jgi:protein phosphatase
MEKELGKNNTPGNRFGHTITMISKDKAILFGGAVGDQVFKITNDVFLFNGSDQSWIKLNPKPLDQEPSPRAAHEATSVGLNQMVVYGGAHSHGNLVDDELYLLKLSNKHLNAKWIKVPIKGAKPKSRYGHSLVFYQPYILIIGGNIEGQPPSNEIWCLNIDNPPFEWERLVIKSKLPEPRVYQSSTIWKNDEKGDMVLMYGGRNEQGKALNDLWGLRRNNNGNWEWVLAPNSDKIIPVGRYQHRMICTKNMLLIIGGRNDKSQTEFNIPINVYLLSSSQWLSFSGINRFRHCNWLIYDQLYSHGGFLLKDPNNPLASVSALDLKELFQENKELLQNTTNPLKEVDKEYGNNLYKVSSEVIIAQFNGDTKMKHVIKLNDLSQENVKIDPNMIVTPKKNLQVKSIYNTTLKYFLNPISWKGLIGSENFLMKSEIIIALCDEVIKVLKEEPMVLNLRGGTKIFGSIHGQYGDLMRFFDIYGVPDNDPKFDKNDIEALDYLFLGNYVDRGKNSLEVICTLLALKLKHPKQIHLLRGSHEDKEININEGLGYECEKRLKDNITAKNSVFEKLNEVFTYFSFAAVIDKKILCIHSGIGENFKNIQQLSAMKKPFLIDHSKLDSLEQKIVFDILWSDPVLDLGEKTNKKNENREYIANGTIIRYGTNMIRDFIETNNLMLMIRSHESILNGAEQFGDTHLYTIFSCTNYGGKNKNEGAIFHYHHRSKQLNTLTLPILKNSTEWWDLDEINKKKNKKSEKFDPKNRPVTPLRNFGRKQTKTIKK